MSGARPYSASWQVGKFTVTMIASASRDPKIPSVVVDWSPRQPRRPLTASEKTAYRTGRDAAAKKLERLIGGPIVILDR